MHWFQSREDALKKDVDLLKQTKVELEKHIEQLVGKIEHCEQTLQRSQSLKALEARVRKVKGHSQC